MLQTIQGVPAGQGRARQGAGLEEVQIGGRADEAVLVEDAVLAQRAVNDTAEARLRGTEVDGVKLVALVEQRHDPVAFLPFRDLGADLDDYAGAVGAGDDGQLEWEGIQSLDSVSSKIRT